EDNPVGQARLAAFLEGLRQLGWADGRNVRIDSRWGADNASLNARELVALAPDVVMAVSRGAVGPVGGGARPGALVVAGVAGAVGAGFVESLAQPGGNVTGFLGYEYTLSGKWLELLKEIAPRVTRAAVLRDSAIAAGPAQFAVIQAVAPSLGVELRPADM